MGNLVRLEEIKCPSCGATLKIQENNTKFIKCEYCGSEFVLNMENEPNHTAAPPGPDWVQMHPVETAPSRVPILAIVVAAAFVISLAGVGALQTRRALRQEQKQTAYKNSVTLPASLPNTTDTISPSIPENASSSYAVMLGTV